MQIETNKTFIKIQPEVKYELLELDPSMLSQLDSLVFRGQEDDNIVLCSSNSTSKKRSVSETKTQISNASRTKFNKDPKPSLMRHPHNNLIMTEPIPNLGSQSG